MAKKLTDVSFAGANVVIGGVAVDDFADDKNPVEIQDTEVCNTEWSCNGRMIRTIKPSAILISVSVIPGSPSDNKLRDRFLRNFSNGGNVDLGAANQSLSCIINPMTLGSDSYTFTNGTFLSGPAAVSSDRSGKMGGNTYTFAFERCE